MSKKCLTCDQILSDKAIKPHCKVCRHREVCLKYNEKNKQKVKEYQDSYRIKNREICNQRTRKSYWKNPEKYNQKGKILYREKHGIPLDSNFKKRKNGEGYIRPEGYKVICVKGHPNAYDKHGKIHEHTFVMSSHLGRALYKHESVHHKNGDRLDNRIENLELWNKGQPCGQRVEDKIEWYIEFLTIYGYKVIKQ